MNKDYFRCSPVFPVIPSYTEDGSLNLHETKSYIQYLIDEGAKNIMTTAGSSQFNLLSHDEIRELNTLVTLFEDVNIILGLPVLSLKHIKEEILYLNQICKNRDNCSFMFLYPDRFYENESIINYFHSVAGISDKPCWIHAMPFRNGITNTTFDYSDELLDGVFKHTNILGMKEESSSYERCFDVCSFITKRYKDVIVCVAGGDQKRFMMSHAAGAKTFLSGAGSIYPRADIKFFKCLDTYGAYDQEVQRFLKNINGLVYDNFCKIGWHRALREALRLKHFGCFYNREPWPQIKASESIMVSTVLDKLESFIDENIRIYRY